MDPLKFQLELKSKDVEIGPDKYILRELDGKQRDAYMNSLARRVSGGGGKQTVNNFEGIQSGLVAMALRKVLPGGEEEAVKETTIQAWPAGVVSALFSAAKDLSGLLEKDEEEKKD